MILRANYCKHQCAAPQTKECPGERGHAGRRGQGLGAPAPSLPRAAAGTVWAQCGHSVGTGCTGPSRAAGISWQSCH